MDILNEISEYVDDQVYVDDSNPDDERTYAINNVKPLLKNKEVELIPLDSLQRQLNRDTPWRDSDGDAISIMDVVSDKSIDPEHYETFSKVDMDIPIIIAPNGEIMDGSHRVGNAVIQGLSSISGYIFDDWDELESAITHDDEGM